MVLINTCNRSIDNCVNEVSVNLHPGLNYTKKCILAPILCNCLPLSNTNVVLIYTSKCNCILTVFFNTDFIVKLLPPFKDLHLECWFYTSCRCVFSTAHGAKMTNLLVALVHVIAAITL